ncbi:MAG: coproporphyrinogen dehydrogenase HemZ, partial [Firmicutes bacterium]|nr:coproporphyrinogen dehydrogenase HemZ [Bacillota bacterium]
TRCLYCSFTSNQKPSEEIKRYLDALHKEIAHVGLRMKETGLGIETLYIGGGTPTTLDCDELRELFSCIRSEMDLSDLREFTLEAGRPDTIDTEKLKEALKSGVTRISINPQTMKQETLDIIGRRHSVEDIHHAFEAAREAGIRNVNCDLIAGLPGETPEDFADSLDKVLDLGPTDVTVHTLALKRASRLIEEDTEYHLSHGDAAREMIDHGADVLRKAGYRPYYLYRLKRMAGALENTGWCREGAAGIYNIRIMDEQQSIVALGAGGMSKVYFPAENRLERVPNVSNYEVYIDRLDEMLQRKETGIFSMIPEIYKQSEDLIRR